MHQRVDVMMSQRLHSEDLIALPHIYAEAEAGEDNTTDAAHPGFPWRCTSAETTRLRQSNCNEVFVNSLSLSG